MQLPKPAPDLGVTQRYQSGGDLPVAPINPPAAVVFLDGDFQHAPKPARMLTGQMTQKNMSFAPDLVAILVGGAVDFPNLDDAYHNVFSYSKAKRFDLGRFRKDEKAAIVVFDQPGTVVVHCDIHERMRGTVLVLGTPYFVKTDTQGRYRLDGLPTGNYTLKAWVSDREVREHQVELKKGSALRVDFPGRSN